MNIYTYNDTYKLKRNLTHTFGNQHKLASFSRICIGVLLFQQLNSSNGCCPLHKHVLALVVVTSMSDILLRSGWVCEPQSQSTLSLRVNLLSCRLTYPDIHGSSGLKAFCSQKTWTQNLPETLNTWCNFTPQNGKKLM